MNSLDYYSIIKGWDVELFLTKGIRYCTIYKKNTQTLKDSLLVEYTDGTRRFVNGIYLFTENSLAIQYIEEHRNRRINELKFAQIELNAKIEKVIKDYLNIKNEKIVGNKIQKTTFSIETTKWN